MEIADLQVRQGNVNVVVELVEKGDVREFQKFGKVGRVCNAKVKDSSGEMTLTLWNDDIDKFNVGDKIRIVNGYVSEWQGEPQLTTGRLGKIEIVDKKSESSGEKKKSSTKKAETKKHEKEFDEEEPEVKEEDIEE